MSDNSDLLTVQEFAYQIEVEKHPSQIYGWMKKGLPFEVVKGKKYIPFTRGLAWIEERKTQSRKTKVQSSIVDGIPGTKQQTFAPRIKPGDFLRWDRGNKLGPAYALVQKHEGQLLHLSAEYWPVTVYFSYKDTLRDIATGKVVVVSAVEVRNFVLEQLSRLDFLTHLVVGPEKAAELKRIIDDARILPDNFIKVMNHNRRRKPIAWPSQQLEETQDDSTDYQDV